MTQKLRGFTLVEIMIVILIIGVLLAIAIPNFISSRSLARQRTCISSLKQINGAKEQFAMENKLENGAAVVAGDIAPAYIKEFPVCADGGLYTINPIGTFPECSRNAGPYAHILP